MNKRRINTTISSRHWEILRKHSAEYESQQKTLEFALECLEERSKSNPVLSPDEQLWMSTYRDMRSAITLIHKSIFEELFGTADCESLLNLYARLKSAEYLVFSLKFLKNNSELNILTFYKQPELIKAELSVFL